METAAAAGDTGTDSGIDIEKASDQIGADLFPDPVADDASDLEVEAPSTETAPAAPPSQETKPVDPAVTDPNQPPPDQEAVAAEAPPKAWPREKHELWKGLTPEAKQYLHLREKQMLDGLDQYKEHATYGRTLKEAITPYLPMIEARGLDATAAVKALLNAQYRLTQGTLEQRRAAYRQLGESLQVIPPQNQGKTNGAADPAAAETPNPMIEGLQTELGSVKSTVEALQTARYTETLQRTTSEVNNFAESHPLFDECAEDIALYIQAGLPLAEAYKKAVWSNPVTREKELARIRTEAEANRQKRDAEEVARARAATSTNVRATDTRKAPTAPLGSMDETMRETLKQIKTRDTH